MTGLHESTSLSLSESGRTVFVSHSQHDKTLLPWFRDIFSVLSVGMFLAEVERPVHPQKEILQAIKDCEAVFVLLTPQALRSSHTQSWIVAETSLGFALGKPVFVFVEHNVEVPFPLPYFSTYTILWLDSQEHFDAIRNMVSTDRYLHEIENALSIHCPKPDCQAESKTLNHPVTFITKCPTCLSPITHSGGKQYLA